MDPKQTCFDLAEGEQKEIGTYVQDADNFVFVQKDVKGAIQTTCYKKTYISRDAADPTKVIYECNEDGTYFGPYQQLSLSIGNIVVNQQRLFNLVMGPVSPKIVQLTKTATILQRTANRDFIQENPDSAVGAAHCQDGTDRVVWMVSSDFMWPFNLQDRVMQPIRQFRPAFQIGPLDEVQLVPSGNGRFSYFYRLSDEETPQRGPSQARNIIQIITKHKTSFPANNLQPLLHSFDMAYRRQSLMRESYKHVTESVQGQIENILNDRTDDYAIVQIQSASGMKKYANRWILHKKTLTSKEPALYVAVMQDSYLMPWQGQEVEDLDGKFFDCNKRSLCEIQVSYWPDQLEETPMSPQIAELYQSTNQDGKANLRLVAMAVHRRTRALEKYFLNWNKVYPNMPQIQEIATEIRNLALTSSFTEFTSTNRGLIAYLQTKKAQLEQYMGPLNDFEIDGVPQTFDVDTFMNRFDFENFGETRQSPFREFYEALTKRLEYLHLKDDL